MFKSITVVTENAEGQKASTTITGGRLALWVNSGGSVTIRQGAGSKSETFRFPSSLRPFIAAVTNW